MIEKPTPEKIRFFLRNLVGVAAMIVVFLLVTLLIGGRGAIAFILAGGLHLPEPTGPYGVGRTTWTVTSETRDEIFTEAEDDKRTIRADVYYPAASGAAGNPGVYMDSSIVEALTGLPSFALSPITPNWIPEAPPNTEDGPYPTLLFSPGFDSPPIYYTSLLEEISSQGYVVVALWHTYTTERVLFVDGRVVESRFEANGAMWEGEEEERDIAKQRVAEAWAKDFVMAADDIIARQANDDSLAEIMDLEKLGAFGHSFGGQAAAGAMTMDKRFRAGLNMDGTSVLQAIMDKGVEGAFAFVYDTFEPPHEYLARENMTVDEWWETWTPRNCPPAIREKASKVYIHQIDGIAHEGFATDLVILRPLFGIVVTEDMVGTVNGNELLPLLSGHIVSYFGEQLLGTPFEKYDSPILTTGIKGHPELADFGI